MTRIVLDTNVLAPEFVGAASTATRLIDLWRSGAYELVVSEHLLAELECVFSKLYYASRLQPGRASQIIGMLRLNAVLTPLTLDVIGVATHPEDDLVLATCLSSDTRYLATRDKQMLKLGSFREVAIFHPGDLNSRLTL